MKIGIDGRSLLVRRTGIGRYVQEMCLALLDLDLDVRIYSPLPLGLDAPIDIRRVCMPPKMGRLGGQAWAQTILPAQVRSDNIDVLWGPAHRLPIFLPESIRSVVTIHDLVWKLYPETMHPRTYLGERLLMGPSIARADAIAADTESTARSLREHFPEVKVPVRVIYPAPPSDKVTMGGGESGNDLALPSDFILFVGTLEARKNLERLLQAYAGLSAELRRQHPLIIAGGDGWKQRDLAEVASQLGIADTVLLKGYVSDADLAILYSKCLFLAFPSIYEGFGLPIVEAHRQGRPVLTSLTSSMPEVGGDASYLVNPLDVDSIRSGFLTLIENRALCEALAAKAESNANRFSWRGSAASLVDLFEEIAAGP